MTTTAFTPESTFMAAAAVEDRGSEWRAVAGHILGSLALCVAFTVLALITLTSVVALA